MHKCRFIENCPTLKALEAVVKVEQEAKSRSKSCFTSIHSIGAEDILRAAYCEPSDKAPSLARGCEQCPTYLHLSQ